MKNFLIVLACLLSFGQAFAQHGNYTPIRESRVGCLPEGLFLGTQANVDSFPVNYPECNTILGPVFILGAEINNLDSLIQLSRIEGIVEISTVELYALSGLDSLNYAGAIDISHIWNLSSLNGLNNLDTIADYLTISGADIEDMSGLENLKHIGGSFQVGGCGELASLTGLQNLNSIHGDLRIGGDNSLNNLTGLNNLSYIDGELYISGNYMLSSLAGLDSLDISALDGLSIFQNSELSVCNEPFVCEYLSNPPAAVNITQNAPGCNNPSEVAVSCGFTLPCLPYGNYYVYSQADADNFQSDYQDCHDLLGDMSIKGDDIQDISGLSNITSINGNLIISGNNILRSLSGLDSLQSISGNLLVGTYQSQNQSLINFEGLGNLKTIEGRFEVHGNSSIGNFEGVGNLYFTGSLIIYGNNSLTSLDGLNKLDSIRNELNITYNSSLTDLLGFLSLHNVNGMLVVHSNEQLQSLSGLDNIEKGSMYNLQIDDNPLLKECDVKSVCNYLASPNAYTTIENNSPGCNSRAEVEDACMVGIRKLETDNSLFLYPNPATDFIMVQTQGNTASGQLTIFNSSGQPVISQAITGAGEWINVSHLPKGLYLIQVAGDNKIRSERFVKVN